MYIERIGLIPAAGQGTRLGLPFPKELYPIISDGRYKPPAQLVLENLVAARVQHIVFVINASKHQLIDYFGDGSRFGCHLSYVVQEQRNGLGHSRSPGLGYAWDAAYHLIKGKIVLFGMADTIMRPVALFTKMLNRMSLADDVVLGLFPTDRPQAFGMVDCDSNRRVLSIIDKPCASDLTYMWGCMAWRPRLTEWLHDCVRSGLTDYAEIMNAALQQGMRFRGVRFDEGAYTDVGTWDAIAELGGSHD